MNNGCFVHFPHELSNLLTFSQHNDPMAGTTVLIKGTYTGTMTGVDGDYELNNVANDAVLVFSTIGYETLEVAVDNRTTINVSMNESVEMLDELVVVGYYTSAVAAQSEMVYLPIPNAYRGEATLADSDGKQYIW